MEDVFTRSNNLFEKLRALGLTDDDIYQVFTTPKPLMLWELEYLIDKRDQSQSGQP